MKYSNSLSFLVVLASFILSDHSVNAKSDKAQDKDNGNNKKDDTTTAAATTASATTSSTPVEYCKLKWQGGKFMEVQGHKCSDNKAACMISDDDGTEGDQQGVCVPAKCSGSSNGQGNQSTGTHRVTICHRTCSKTNPWVRITIDNDAWGDVNGDNASGCGHQTQHDVSKDCNVKDQDYTPWGASYTVQNPPRDYLIKDHGQKDDYTKDYWKEWEHACPYVRAAKGNGKECCDWDSGECCGDPPASFTTAATTVATTVKPTVATTPKPTVAATSPTGGPQCPSSSLVTLGAIGGKPASSVPSELDPLPITVTSFGANTVTFSVCNTYHSGVVNEIYTEYNDAQAGNSIGSSVCVGQEDIGLKDSQCDSYTASCMTLKPFAIVDVYVTGEGLPSDSPLAPLPECCHGDSNNASNVIHYTFKVACQCPDVDSARRYLRSEV